MPHSRGPISTYRLQLTPDFGFVDAAGLAPYLADLGVTHVYLSPVLQAAPGSTHGYDVTDHSRISTDLGGADAFRAMAARFRESGLRIVLDLVPNHMAIPAPETLNRQLWQVLRDGPGATDARWFDIDWDADEGRMILPVLGGPVPECLPELSVSADGPVLRYYDHVFPLRPGTEDLPLPDLLDAQHYRLAWWREAAGHLNWRRFFDISTLIGVRVEDPEVFRATHEVVLELVADGLVDALRIDHPDGLADPRGYLRRLTAAAPGTWIVVEKILEADERLPGDWPCAGTTGYDALRVVDGLFVDPAGGDALLTQYARFAGTEVPRDFATVAFTAKREVASDVLAAETRRLARRLRAIDSGTGAPAYPEDGAYSEEDVRTVLTEVLAAFPVYRAYVYPGEPVTGQSSQAVRTAIAGALTRLPECLHPLVTTVADLALGGDAEFATRFGQTTGPVLAKGIEDTAAYRWPRLIARNEVGGDPDRFAVPVTEFHAFAQRLAADWPRTMTTLSTHDTKRQEDVRARLAVLAEAPAEWGCRVAEWHATAMALLPEDVLREVGGIDPETSYLVWQTIVGAWPIDAERLSAYLTKAMREAKARTSWIDVNAEYEDIVQRLAALALEHSGLRTSIEEFVSSITADALANSLGAKLVQLTMPGVPDVCQGCELAGLSLVDPDNRRPVDYARRRDLLRALDNGTEADDLDSAKLLVTSRALRLRRDHPDWFTGGDYTPLTAAGPAAGHVVAFARGSAVTVVTRLPRGLRQRDGWADTTLELSGPVWRDVLTGQLVSRRVKLADLLKRLPVAMLIPEPE